MAPEFVRFFSFIKLVIYEFTCNGQISDNPSNDKKWDSSNKLLSWKLYNNIIKTTGNKCRVLTQPAMTCSKLTIETVEQGVKDVQS